MDTLDSALLGLVIALVSAVIAMLGWAGKVIPGWITRLVELRFRGMETELAENTELTTKTYTAANGKLAAALNDSQKWRSIAERYSRLMHELNKIEEARPFMDRAAQNLRAVEYDASWTAFETKLFE